MALSLFLVVATAKANNKATSSHADVVFKRARPMVFQIKTATTANSPKTSYGSGFVVSKDGLLATNYHVVATAVQDEDRRYSIFVKIGKDNIPANVVAFDIINDLALVKIERVFEEALDINPKGVKVGEKIFSIGLPKDLEMSIVEGNYNGVLKEGVYRNILMSSPINSGMSGGPTLNKRGEVIGVNVSILLDSQNISFSVPSENVLKLIEEYEKGGKESVDKKVDEIVEKQLFSVQNHLLEDMLKGDNKNGQLGRWEFLAPPKSVKCWSNNKNDKKKTYNWKTQVCYLNKASYIRDDTYSGSYEIRYMSLENKKQNGIQYYNKIRAFYNDAGKYSNVFLRFYNTDVYTKYDCNEQIIVNSASIPFKINYCMRAFIKYKNLYNIYFKAVSLLKGRNAFIMKARLEGFSKENILKFIKKQISTIKITDNEVEMKFDENDEAEE